MTPDFIFKEPIEICVKDHNGDDKVHLISYIEVKNTWNIPEVSSEGTDIVWHRVASVEGSS